MTFFLDPIKPSEGRQKDDYRVPLIESDPRGKDPKQWTDRFQSKDLHLFTIILNFFTDVTHLFDLGRSLDKKNKEEPFIQRLINSLQHFQHILNRLKEDDCSENNVFCSELSAAWSHLLQEIDMIRHRKEKDLIDWGCFLKLIDDIKFFPQESEHQLGYYLSHYAGMNWLPQPLIELLKKLHFEYLGEIEKSDLYKWNHQISLFLRGISHQDKPSN